MKPNLFNYATSELSQDAFLLWLLEWANPSNSEYDLELYKTASDFLRKIIDVDEKFDIKSVVCKKQQYHIDVLAIVNDKIAVIIEDKINTQEHGNQIARYRQQLETALGTQYDIKCIYLKTGNECLTKLRENADKGNFKIFMRQDLLKILDKSNSDNTILKDFVLKIKEVEESSNQYKSKPYHEWMQNGFAWQGFYSWLEDNLGNYIEWRYVSNPNGGFWGCYWHWKWCKAFNFTIYLQIEQNRICFKADNKPNIDCIKKCQEKIYSIALEKNLKIEKSRFHRGNYVTICFVDTSYLFDKGFFEEKEILAKISNLTKIIDSIAD